MESLDIDEEEFKSLFQEEINDKEVKISGPRAGQVFRVLGQPRTSKGSSTNKVEEPHERARACAGMGGSGAVGGTGWHRRTCYQVRVSWFLVEVSLFCLLQFAWVHVGVWRLRGVGMCDGVERHVKFLLGL